MTRQNQARSEKKLKTCTLQVLFFDNLNFGNPGSGKVGSRNQRGFFWEKNSQNGFTGLDSIFGPWFWAKSVKFNKKYELSDIFLINS